MAEAVRFKIIFNLDMSSEQFLFPSLDPFLIFFLQIIFPHFPHKSQPTPIPVETDKENALRIWDGRFRGGFVLRNWLGGDSISSNEDQFVTEGRVQNHHCSPFTSDITAPF